MRLMPGFHPASCLSCTACVLCVKKLCLTWELISTLPATQHEWMRPTLTPARQAGTRFTYPNGIKGWVDVGGQLQTDMVCLSQGTNWAQHRATISRHHTSLNNLIQYNIHIRIEKYSILHNICFTSSLDTVRPVGKDTLVKQPSSRLCHTFNIVLDGN